MMIVRSKVICVSAMILIAAFLVGCKATTSTTIPAGGDTAITATVYTAPLEQPNAAPIEESQTDLTPTTVSPPTSTPAPTSSPTPEPPPVPTAIPDAKLYVISINQDEEVPPDLMEHLLFYVPGAGGGNFGEETSGYWTSSYENEIIPAVPRDLYWAVENMADSPSPQATLTLPDGTVIQSQLDLWNGFTSFSYPLAPGAPLGTYSLTITQGSLTLQDSVTLELPTEPIQTQYEDNYWFAGFMPNEQVVITLYFKGYYSDFQKPEIAALFPELPDISRLNNPLSPDAFYDYLILAFLTRQTIIADEYGSFQIELTSNDIRQSIVASARGEISGLICGSNFSTEGACGDSLPPQLEVGSTARITDYAGELQVRAQDFSWVTLRPGTTVTLILGPICNSHAYHWSWLVDTPSNAGLLVSESDANGYFLEPVSP